MVPQVAGRGPVLGRISKVQPRHCRHCPHFGYGVSHKGLFPEIQGLLQAEDNDWRSLLSDLDVGKAEEVQ